MDKDLVDSFINRNVGGDALKIQNNKEFSLKDKGKMRKAQQFKGGWWYENIGHICNLTIKPGTNEIQSVNLYLWRQNENLAGVEIK
ncbi:hypothetical protein AVEN_235184-1, partial [Araneus ventricosus]